MYGCGEVWEFVDFISIKTSTIVTVKEVVVQARVGIWIESNQVQRPSQDSYIDSTINTFCMSLYITLPCELLYGNLFGGIRGTHRQAQPNCTL